jgi:hypothetical protein
MAGPAPITFKNREDRFAGPVHSSGWLCDTPRGLHSPLNVPLHLPQSQRVIQTL